VSFTRCFVVVRRYNCIEAGSSIISYMLINNQMTSQNEQTRAK
jgi:hypothetical protein